MVSMKKVEELDKPILVSHSRYRAFVQGFCIGFSLPVSFLFNTKITSPGEFDASPEKA
jgi:hypothetical protein